MKTALCASLLVLAMLMQPAASAKDLKTPRPVERSLIATTSAYTIEEEIHCADQRKRTVDYCESAILSSPGWLEYGSSLVVNNSYTMAKDCDAAQITLHVTECGKDEDGNAYCEETSKACLTWLWGTKPNGKEDYTNFCPAGFWDRESMGDFDCDSWTIPDAGSYLDGFKTVTYMPGCSDNFYSLVDQNGDPLEAYEQRAYSCTVEGPFMRWRYMLSGADAQATVTGLTNTLMCKPSPHKRFVFHLADTPSLSAGPDTVWEACPGVDWPGPWDAAATGAPSWLLLLTASAMLVLYSGV